MFTKYDILHIHWPEAFVRGSSSIRTVIKCMLAQMLLLRVLIFRTPVVRTVHNMVPHESLTPLQNWLLTLFDRVTTIRVYMTKSSKQEANDPSGLVIRHGHYRDWFPDTSQTSGKEQSAPEVLFFGAVRPYKGVEDLIMAFSEIRNRAHLTIAGKPTTKEYGDSIRKLASAVPNCSLNLNYISDSDLWSLLAATTLVALPFRSVTNSGSMLLALSANVPVLTSESSLAEETRDEYGPLWIRIFPGNLDAYSLEQAIDWAQSLTSRPRLNMSDRDWSIIGEDYVKLYQTLYTVNESRTCRANQGNLGVHAKF